MPRRIHCGPHPEVLARSASLEGCKRRRRGLHPSRLAALAPQDEVHRGELHCSRDAFCARALPTPFPNLCLHIKEGEAERRSTPRLETAPALRMSTSEPAASAASATIDPRYREPLACGRPRLSALRRGTRQALRLAQLRAALTGVCSGSRRHNPFY